ncbi:hypothetical protein NNJEOMEG_01560 [Fundidesulfovibrio magnetotacticus]|uniref:Uncharacterized protein n=1 Tax=Fundidesulfovibrio magnetotacticus TaxID=2730080 RepID=A0A6V8LV80_9BACT|nr:hypothetical protein [Fundidesulfovibrio magnetotacticus]GFK93726.1 hypothetical protein NNJEOMEG_01560 [Fundidesulfovibrio magnetotacticus]
MNSFSRHISALKSAVSDIASTSKKAAAAKSEEEGTRLQENLQKLKDQARDLMTRITAEADRIEAQINTDLVTFQSESAVRSKLSEELTRLTKLRQNAAEQFAKLSI